MTAALCRTIAGTALAALLGLPAASAGADGATYTVFSCRGPEGTPVSTRAWQGDTGDTGLADGCAAGGALAARVAGPRTGTGLVSGVRFIAPPGARIAGYRIHLTAETEQATPGTALQAGLSLGSLIQLPPVSIGCPAAGCSFGDPADALAAANLVTSAGLPTPGLVLVARCAAGACQPPDPGGLAARVRLWRSAVDLVDDAPPAIGVPVGSLLGPGPVTGRASIAAPVADVGGGIAAVSLRIDGVERARVDPGGDCVRPYTLVAPCPATLPASLETDTGTLAEGAHVAELCAIDAAGQTTGSGPIPFTIERSAAGGGGGTPNAGPAAPATAEIDLDRTRISLPARGRQVAGLVRRADGRPAVGAQLVVRSRRFGAGAPRARTERTLRTDAAGRFAFPAGTTPRRLVVALDDAGYRAADSDEVLVFGTLGVTLGRAGATLRNGSRMALDVRVTGAGDGAPDGRPVLMQALVAGRWKTVDSVEVDGRGRATWRYRFRSTTRRTTYRFRAQIPRGGSEWPWPVTTSSNVAVPVDP